MCCLLVSRYANVDENAVNGLIDTVIAMVKDFPQTTGYLERIWGLIRFPLSELSRRWFR